MLESCAPRRSQKINLSVSTIGSCALVVQHRNCACAWSSAYGLGDEGAPALLHLCVCSARA
eukprot:6268680-Amphidinium_carterae.1